MRKIKLSNQSIRCIEEALTEKINAFSPSNKGYNQSRIYRKALKQIRNGAHDRQVRYQGISSKKG